MRLPLLATTSLINIPPNNRNYKAPSIRRKKDVGHVGQQDTPYGCVHVCPYANVLLDKLDMSIKCPVCPHHELSRLCPHKSE